MMWWRIESRGFTGWEFIEKVLVSWKPETMMSTGPRGQRGCYFLHWKGHCKPKKCAFVDWWLCQNFRFQKQYRIQDSSFITFQKLFPINYGKSLHVMFFKICWFLLTFVNLYSDLFSFVSECACVRFLTLLLSLLNN